MMKLLTGLAVGSAMLVGVGAAQAEPLKLSLSQMDGVTAAGFISVASARANALALFGRVNVASTSASTFTAPGVAASNSRAFSLSRG
jgi:hypothetical protein